MPVFYHKLFDLQFLFIINNAV